MAKVVKKKVGKPTAVWTKERIAELKKLYPEHPTELVAQKMGLTVRSVRSAAVKYKAKKTKNYWDMPQEKWLIDNWSVMSAEELADKLGRTKWAIINKYRELTGLRS